MDIDEIESLLDSFETTPEKAIAEMLKITIKNQAVLEAILAINAQILVEIKKDGSDPKMFNTALWTNIFSKMAEIQAKIVSSS